MENTTLNTSVLPEYNCSNCEFFGSNKSKAKELVDTSVGKYSIECHNMVHPILDCVLRGFQGHSDQPGFSQTLNKPHIEVVKKESDFQIMERKPELTRPKPWKGQS